MLLSSYSLLFGVGAFKDTIMITVVFFFLLLDFSPTSAQTDPKA